MGCKGGIMADGKVKGETMTTKKNSEPKSTAAQETAAMEKAYNALRLLDPDSQRRALLWLASRLRPGGVMR